jgi:hypothetical protein
VHAVFHKQLWLEACRTVSVMLRLLSSGRNLTQILYTLWTRTSAAVIVLWAALSGDSSWIATIGLSALLILLLLGGIVLLVLGVRDLARDLRHHFHVRSEKNTSS